MSEELSIVFLDIDGVLNNQASLMLGCKMLPEKVMLVRQLCDITESKIVISSMWRDIYEWNALKLVLGCAGLAYEYIHGKTDCNGGGRSMQIHRYLKTHKIKSRYVIIDDEDHDWRPYQKPHFVQIPMESGLRWKDVQKAVEIFSRKGDES